MDFKIFTNYINGVVDILVEGYYIERFINICNFKNIYIWDLKRDKSTILYAKINRKDFKKLRNVCKKSNCKVKILNKKGASFFFDRYKKRKIFFYLLMLITVFIIIISNFIWNIEIIGLEDIDKQEILEIAKQNGLKVGKLKNKIDTKKIINDLRLKREDIAWAGIEIKGTNAIIKITKADLKPDIVDENEYFNIVSDKNCEILKINARNGTALVNIGDIIKKGDILIGGWLDGKYTGTRYVHAQGEIIGKVWYTDKQRVYLRQTIKEETGNIENKYSININNFKINFYKRLSNFQKYDTIEENKNIKIFSNFYLPIELIKYTNKEYKNITKVYSIEEAEKIGKDIAKQNLNKQIENIDNILNEYVNINKNIEYVDIEVIYEIQENIGTKEKIIF